MISLSQTQFNPEDGCSMFLRNIGTHLQEYMVLKHKRPQLEPLPLWKPENFTKHLRNLEVLLSVINDN
jgi:hypothetical protein